MNFEVGPISLLNNTIMAIFFLGCIVIAWGELTYSKFELKRDKITNLIVLLVLVVLFLWSLVAIKEAIL
ncbi:hypothetical protein BPS13_0045 [Bacillus phage BPS13]|uniref:Uncharacterized protein n=3 Tax=Wphvirus TaxID=1922327 RepID=W5QUT5_9CAUD|nr:hypothetical protein BPS13_0045 [Bacillus phage BPS13]YP_009002931.1 hypothetical protein BPS10C_045 [Bacillus phage BPS10C]YP_009281984.1 hypothetical protein SALINJAH_30 [Bacillus phage SalinJah]AEZ50224.1 hypothetical protein BPS13_0045 [Bacillus phage BPS13]AGI12042.1 hypothetical protein BPS10C_045 [Bacillus phage BPS10C]ANH50676.1 hypothetical protein SALINJAH_30 [Bacillus phage SalinJah]